METPENDRVNDAQEKRNAPTVSREKWHHHAVTKMARGYFLIVGTQRRSANFYLPGKGYETCSYNIATQLVKEGVVVEAGEHYLGTLYALAEQPSPQKPKPAAEKKIADPDPDVEDDLTLLLNADDALGSDETAAWD